MKWTLTSVVGVAYSGNAFFFFCDQITDNL